MDQDPENLVAAPPALADEQDLFDGFSPGENWGEVEAVGQALINPHPIAVLEQNLVEPCILLGESFVDKHFCAGPGATRSPAPASNTALGGRGTLQRALQGQHLPSSCSPSPVAPNQ